MEDPAEPCSWLLLSVLKPLSAGSLIGFAVLLLLLILSALISGSEVAFFSLSPADKKKLEDGKSRAAKTALRLLRRPNYLLATILIANNFINVAIIILSTYIVDSQFDFSEYPTLGFVIQVIVVTLVILLVGEVIPKVRANRRSLAWAGMMSLPLLFLVKLFWPVSRFLVWSTGLFNRHSASNKGEKISVDELSHALELAKDVKQDKEEEKILKGIVRFGNTDVKQIMTSRVDVVGFEENATYTEVLQGILDSGFSRLPVYRENLDQLVGLIYIKDLLPHIDEAEDFNWQKLIRQPMFVPENKKIDDLLAEFQEEKMHMAIVVDEYGGASGIVTLEDILEEIVGEISDEFDDDDLVYSRLDDLNYIFEGKTPLNDLYRVLEIDGTNFEDAKGESDTLAGLVLELAGKIPRKNEKVKFEGFVFTIDAADKRRVKRVKVTLPKPDKVKSNGQGKTLSVVWLALIGLATLLSSCGSEYFPKPRGYHRIDFPPHEYHSFSAECPFSFDYGAEALMIDETKRGGDTCRFNVHYPEYQCTVHLTYKEITGQQDRLELYMKDARELAYQHTTRADEINESTRNDSTNQVYGVSYDLEGPVASNFQFYLTDHKHHFVRGAMYFQLAPNPDSLGPVTDYIKEDITRMLDSFRWKEAY